MRPRSPATLLLMLLGAAVAHPAQAADGGELSVFSDQMAFAIEAPGPDQLAHGYFGGGSISGLFPTEEPGHVLLVTPPGDAVVGRRLDQKLSDLPFLTWNWRRRPPDMGPPETLTDDAPMRLIVGFDGGASLRPPLAKPRRDAELPPSDRALVVVWSNHPWEAGAADRDGPWGRFIAHGGEADDQWWQQSVDLVDLHSRLWPEIPVGEVRVAWIAVGVRRTEGRSLGEIAGITLAP